MGLAQGFGCGGVRLFFVYGKNETTVFSLTIQLGGKLWCRISISWFGLWFFEQHGGMFGFFVIDVYVWSVIESIGEAWVHDQMRLTTFAWL